VYSSQEINGLYKDPALYNIDNLEDVSLNDISVDHFNEKNSHYNERLA
jgi:hypothetical protein